MNNEINELLQKRGIEFNAFGLEVGNVRAATDRQIFKDLAARCKAYASEFKRDLRNVLAADLVVFRAFHRTAGLLQRRLDDVQGNRECLIDARKKLDDMWKRPDRLAVVAFHAALATLTREVSDYRETVIFPDSEEKRERAILKAKQELAEIEDRPPSAAPLSPQAYAVVIRSMKKGLNLGDIARFLGVPHMTLRDQYLATVAVAGSAKAYQDEIKVQAAAGMDRVLSSSGWQLLNVRNIAIQLVDGKSPERLSTELGILLSDFHKWLEINQAYLALFKGKAV